MDAGGARGWLERLAALLGSTGVTDAAGVPLDLEQGVERSVAQLHAAGKVLLAGNGGSAAIASHMHNDLCKTAGVRAAVFHETPLLTACANDDGYETAFERGVRLWAEEGDVVLAISSSGRSENILRAVRAGRERGCSALTLSGFRSDNPLRREGEVNFHVASEVYGLVEVAHMALGHILTDRLAALRRGGA